MDDSTASLFDTFELAGSSEEACSAGSGPARVDDDSLPAISVVSSEPPSAVAAVPLLASDVSLDVVVSFEAAATGWVVAGWVVAGWVVVGSVVAGSVESDDGLTVKAPSTLVPWSPLTSIGCAPAGISAGMRPVVRNWPAASAVAVAIEPPPSSTLMRSPGLNP